MLGLIGLQLFYKNHVAFSFPLLFLFLLLLQFLKKTESISLV